MGFNLAGVPGQNLSVRNVIPGSDAERVGLREGDELVEFNGTSIREMNREIFLGAAAAGAPVKVVVKREGKTLEFQIRPYLPQK
jgi:S1-C subfamily serine protease